MLILKVTKCLIEMITDISEAIVNCKLLYSVSLALGKKQLSV